MAEQEGTATAAAVPARSAAPAQWRNLLALGVVLLGLAVVAFFVLKPAASSGSNAAAGPAPGSAAPSFTLKSVTGATVSLTALRGHPVLINFWFTNCPPCRTEMPDLQRAYTALRAKGLVILGVDAQGEDAGSIRAFADPLGVSYPLLLDPDGHVTIAYRVDATPVSFFIDRRGIVRQTHVGPLTVADVQAGLRHLE